MEGQEVWGIIMGILLMIILGSMNLLRNEMVRTNITLEKIAKHMGVSDPETENIDDELKELIAKNKKISAVKRYRMVTGRGLKESKEYIDSLSRDE
jgi:ribosomal protein L7/L12